MGLFAKVDENNIVETVIVAEKDFNDSGVFGDQSLWKEVTSNGEVGWIYDETKKDISPPQPFLSWVLDETDNSWKPPKDYPGAESVPEGKMPSWNEEAGKWKFIDDV